MEKSNNQNPSNEIQLHEKQHLSDEQDGKNYETTYILGDLQDGKKAIKAQEGDAGEERETWGKKIDFILSVVGFSVDLANIWRFPYLCYSNGGGAFLIPYTMMLLAGGIPLFYMELALGQFNKAGAITCWGALCPLFKGTGWAVVLIAFYTDFFYNVIIAWCLHFFFSSFQADLPWTTCGNDWNTEHCFDGTERVSKNTTVTDGSNSSRTTIGLSKILSTVTPLINNSSANATTVIAAVSSNKSLVKSSAQEYFERGMLQSHESSGFLDFGMLNWQLVLCLLGVFLICYFSMWKGILVSGKVVWFTALFPYCVLLILMVKGATLPGAGVGVKYYLTPNITKLGEAKVWVEAANQVFFSLGPGFGVLLAFSSYNPIHNNVYRDALMTSVINCATSFFSGFIIFMVLGYMAERTNQPIDKVATHGPGLVFIVYPEAIATLPGASFWAVIFFLMLLTMGLDSSFGGSEAIITALSDEFPILRKKRELFVGCLFSVYFIIGLTICSQGGIYIFQLMEKFAAGYSILFAVFFETLAMSWCYGVDLFCSDIEVMIGHRPGRYWPICWKYVAPLFLMFIIVFGLVNFEPLNYEGYKYPLSGNMIGWTIALSSILCIPGFAIYGLLTTRGTLMERLNILITPTNNREEKIRRALQTVTINGDISCAVDV